MFAGEKATRIYGPDVAARRNPCRRCATTWCPSKDRSPRGGGGIRSLNVALRQELDLYVPAPVQYFQRRAIALKEPEKTNMVIFRENSKTSTRGIEWEAEVRQGQEAHPVFAERTGRHQDPLPQHLWASASSPCRAKAPSA